MKKHLLVIEDDVVDQMAFKRFAEQNDFPYTYQLVNTIGKAKKALKTNKFDLVLSDYFLTDGTTFEILDLNIDLPFIVITGTGSETIAVNAIKHGAYDYLIKDIDGFYLKMLPITILNALHRFKTEKKLQTYQTDLESLIVERTKELQIEIEERKKAEQINIQQKKNLNNILEGTNAGTWDWLIESGKLTINNRWAEIMGYTVEELKPITVNTWSDNVHPEDLKKANLELDKVFSKKINYFDVEFRQPHKNGQWVWVNARGKVVEWDSNDKPIKMSGIHIDITNQKKQELVREVVYNITKKAQAEVSLQILFNFIKLELSKLINTNNFFIALYNGKTDMISTPYMVDEQDDADDFPKGKTLTGYVIDTKKVLVANAEKIITLEKAGKIERFGPLSKCWVGIPLLLDNKAIGAIVVQSYEDENAFTNKDVDLLEVVAGNISQVIKQTQDFEHINLLNQAMVQSSESVVVTNIDGEIEYVNPAFTAVSGYTEKEVLGQNPRILKSGDQTQVFYEQIWDTILSGNTWNGEFINKRKDDQKYLVLASISPVRDKKGMITHFIGIEEDITEKRKLEHDFIQAFIDAQEQEKQSFGEDLHDGISQILAAESMYIDVLMKLHKDGDKTTNEHLKKIKELNLSAINDARSIAHGLMSKQLKESGLLIAVEHICIDYSQTKSVKFKFKYKDLVESDFSEVIKTNIFRIIQECSTNTIRHSLAKVSTISMKRLENNQLKMVIKDDGVGIDFEKMKREKRGAGLKNIERRVTLLKGTVKLESEPNKGTCYTVIVPLTKIQ